tara:strand:- start:213 stop:1217 length:1005 start_codon:yes stop_codon:yes gene_type:complete
MAFPFDKNQPKNRLMSERFKEVLELNPEDIFIPKEVKGTGNNVTRISLDQQNIATLQMSLQTPDWSQPFIVVKPIRGGITENGKTYRWQLVAGYHRMYALLRNQVPVWYFDWYEFETAEEELDFQALENNHLPRKEMDLAGLTNYLAFKVDNGMIPNTKESMDAEVEKFTNIHGRTKTAAVTKAVSRCGAYTDVTIRDFSEIKEYLANPENYDGNTREYTHSGNIDPFRNKHGWTVKEGYEHEFIMNAVKRFSETGKGSYFVNHVKEPTDKMTLQQRRDNMVSTFTTLELALKRVIDYYNENDVFPWESVAFMPQNNVRGSEENEFIPVRDAVG